MTLMFRFFLALICLFSLHVNASDTYPNKPLTIIVGFGKGGSTDRLARTMAPYLEKELGEKINVVNMSGGGSSVAVEYLLEGESDGYTVLCSTFSPYLPIGILKGRVFFKMEDLAVLNIQWYDYDLIASYYENDITSLPQMLTIMREGQQKLRIAVMENSSGYLLLRLLMEQEDIPLSSIELKLFNSGAKARASVTKGEVDAIIISAEQSEFNREKIQPLTIHSLGRHDQWDVPTVNDVLAYDIPYIPGSMRGFALSQVFKDKYPKRYEKLENAFKRVLARKEVQRALKKNKVGGSWTGSKRSQETLSGMIDIFRTYQPLLR